MTAPLTSADCDLRDFAFMPLDVVRLRDSDLAATESPEACWAAVLLWAASWHQVPSASLPDDDRVLANLSGYGRVVKEWQKVRDGALRGWIKCSDGRLYHPVVAEKAREAWTGKLQQRHRTECARIRKFNERHGTTHACPTFEDWIAAGCPTGQTANVTRDTPPMSQGQPPDVTRDMAGMSQGQGCEMQSKGKGQGQGQGQGQGETRGEGATQAPPPTPAPSRKREQVTLSAYLAVCKASGKKPVPDDHHVRRWCADAGIGAEMQQVAWVLFRDRYTKDEKAKNKRYKDWPGHFENAVKGNWFKLWYMGNDGQPVWSSDGMTHKAALDNRMAQREASHGVA
jgi:hypothetical protein